MSMLRLAGRMVRTEEFLRVEWKKCFDMAKISVLTVFVAVSIDGMWI